MIVSWFWIDRIIHPYEVSFEPTRRWMQRAMIHNDALILFVGEFQLIRDRTFARRSLPAYPLA